MSTITALTSLLGVLFAANLTPNLCDDVYLAPTGAPVTDYAGQTLARYCAWTGPDAPVWDNDVCCSVDESGATCVRPLRSGRCRVGFKMYCEYGEAVAGGGVACYQPFQSMCDWGLCLQATHRPPTELPNHVGCCSSGGVCQLVSSDDLIGCQGFFLACNYGVQNGDGTIDCYDY
jgi:hypothetical protein